MPYVNVSVRWYVTGDDDDAKYASSRKEVQSVMRNLMKHYGNEPSVVWTYSVRDDSGSYTAHYYSTADDTAVSD